MIRSATDYANLIRALLPVGRLWEMLLQDVLFNDLIDALGEELARVEARAADIIDETDPRTAVELLFEWEQYYALPEPCATPPDTVDERQRALHAKRIEIGGQSRQYFIDIAAALGFAITITEYRPHHCELDCQLGINGQEWAWAWQVNAALNTITDFTVDSACTEPLRSWGNDLLECVIDRLKPGHTHVLYSYS